MRQFGSLDLSAALEKMGVEPELERSGTKAYKFTPKDTGFCGINQFFLNIGFCGINQFFIPIIM